ncbi:S-ribosylhomocysteine lyase [Aerococcaceae bacterium DSM 111020]|nr:S-ribosylhomocysteine lyase [Aerococcaceae bacterium DSM 111020]
MKKIESFTVDHTDLQPGLYLSRQDHIGERTLNSFDLRMTAPNHEQVMNTGEMHTLEHLIATYLRNDETFKDDVIYFGPMGCRTGFYAIFTDALQPEDVLSLLTDAFDFARHYDDEIPGASAEDCGNWLDHNPVMSRYYAEKYYQILKKWSDLSFSYN